MAINRHLMEKIREEVGDDDNMREFLTALVLFEAENAGRYTKEYKDLLKKHAEREVEK